MNRRQEQLEIAEVFEPLIAPRRWKGAKGGRGSGKSFFFGELANMSVLRKPKRIVCVREVQNTIRDSVRALLIGIIQKHQLPGFQILEAEIRHTNGSLIIFRGMNDNNAEGVKSLEDFDIAWVEEAQTLSHRSFEILYPTLRKPGSELWFSWNPRYPDDPVDKFFRENAHDPDVVCVEANWRDNPWFSEELAKDRERDMRTDPARSMHVWEGQYMTVLSGAYWARDIATAVDQGRVRKVERDVAASVYAAMDLGIDDATAVWIFQVINGEWRWLKYYENQGLPLHHYLDWMKGLPYKVDLVLMPHDAEAREYSSGKSRKIFAEERGFQVQVVKQHRIDDGIEAVRMVLNRCYWEITDCAPGLHALRSYRTDYNDRLKTFAPRPLHDWASHGADAFRYAVMGIREGHLPMTRRSDWSKKLTRDAQGTYA